jgi:hypothetical protein
MADKVKLERVNITLTGLKLRHAYLQGEGRVQTDMDGIPTGKPNRFSCSAYLPKGDPQVKKLQETVLDLAIKNFSNAEALIEEKLFGLPYTDMERLKKLGQKVHESEEGMIRIRPWTLAKPADDKYALKILDKYREPFTGVISRFDATANLILTLSPYREQGSTGITMFLSLVQITENGTSTAPEIDLDSLPALIEKPVSDEDAPAEAKSKAKADDKAEVKDVPF